MSFQKRTSTCQRLKFSARLLVVSNLAAGSVESDLGSVFAENVSVPLQLIIVFSSL